MRDGLKHVNFYLTGPLYDTLLRQSGDSSVSAYLRRLIQEDADKPNNEPLPDPQRELEFGDMQQRLVNFRRDGFNDGTATPRPSEKCCMCGVKFKNHAKSPVRVTNVFLKSSMPEWFVPWMWIHYRLENGKKRTGYVIGACHKKWLAGEDMSYYKDSEG